MNETGINAAEGDGTVDAILTRTTTEGTFDVICYTAQGLYLLLMCLPTSMDLSVCCFYNTFSLFKLLFSHVSFFDFFSWLFYFGVFKGVLLQNFPLVFSENNDIPLSHGVFWVENIGYDYYFGRYLKILAMFTLRNCFC